MEILKDTIRYRGNDYPCVTIDFSDEEQNAYCIASEEVFADETLWDLISSNDKWEENGNNDGEEDVDGEIAYYMNDRMCERFCNDEISLEEIRKEIVEVFRQEWLLPIK
jgi:hypothetical protein